MKLGTLMDPNPERRGTQAFMFNTRTEEVEPIDDDEEGIDSYPPNTEPEPDDPDAP